MAYGKYEEIKTRRGGNQRLPSNGPLEDTIDPRLPDEEATIGPIKDLFNLPVDDKELSKALKLGKNLSDEL